MFVTIVHYSLKVGPLYLLPAPGHIALYQILLPQQSSELAVTVRQEERAPAQQPLPTTSPLPPAWPQLLRQHYIRIIRHAVEVKQNPLLVIRKASCQAGSTAGLNLPDCLLRFSAGTDRLVHLLLGGVTTPPREPYTRSCTGHFDNPDDQAACFTCLTYSAPNTRVRELLAAIWDEQDYI